jgi:hypothetical protein
LAAPWRLTAWAQGLIDMAAAQNDGVYDAEPRTPLSTTSSSQPSWPERAEAVPLRSLGLVGPRDMVTRVDDHSASS